MGIGGDKTVQDVIDSMTEEQKNAMYFMVGKAMEDKGDTIRIGGDKTVQDVINSMTEEQKNVMYFMVGKAMEDMGTLLWPMQFGRLL